MQGGNKRSDFRLSTRLGGMRDVSLLDMKKL